MATVVHKICCRKLTFRQFKIYISYSVDLVMRSPHLPNTLSIGIRFGCNFASNDFIQISYFTFLLDIITRFNTNTDTVEIIRQITGHVLERFRIQGIINGSIRIKPQGPRLSNRRGHTYQTITTSTNYPHRKKNKSNNKIITATTFTTLMRI